VDRRLGERGMEAVTEGGDVRLELASLVADRVLVIHMPLGEELRSDLGGNDVDCAVVGLDRTWPLRLPMDWRLCNSIHYDLRGWYWVLERKGELLALDTIDDPLGLGRDSFRESLTMDEGANVAPSSMRAAYLTAKRVRKGIRTEAEWERIGRYASVDPPEFERHLRAMVGRPLSRLVSEAALEGRVPDPAAFEISRRLLWVRRFGSPRRLVMAGALGLRRYVERITQPTGLTVLIAGPDGSGKSTLAEELPDACGGIFKRRADFHWRPGLLPPLGRILGREARPTDEPHAAAPHSAERSIAVLGYYWLDFVIGGVVRLLPVRLRAGLVVMQRGWWDMVVDPTRYRLRVPEPVVRALGALTPRVDLALILDAPTGVLLERKEELEGEELDRQTEAWHHALPRRVPRVHLDSSSTAEEMVRDAREAVLTFMEARTTRRLAYGWATLPPVGPTRWWIPRGPARTSASAMAIHNPMREKGRRSWEAATRFVEKGALRLLPRGTAPPREVRRRLAPFVPSRTTFAVAPANHPGRYTALLVDDRGRHRGLAKIATTESGETELAHEAEAIRTLGSALPAPLRAPRILAHEPGLLLLEAVPKHLVPRPWLLEEDVAAALGRFFSTTSTNGSGELRGSTHGDLAPWNLLHTADGVVLVDWESAGPRGGAFYDICHWLAQTYSLLGRPSYDEVLRGVVDGRGWIGIAIEAYADAAGCSREDAIAAMRSYLEARGERPWPTATKDRNARRALERLSAALQG
jgi:hypothetical protein